MNRRVFLSSASAVLAVALPVNTNAGVIQLVTDVPGSSASLTAAFNRYIEARDALNTTDHDFDNPSHPDFVARESKLWADYYHARDVFFAHPCPTQEDARAKVAMVFEDRGLLSDVQESSLKSDQGMSPLEVLLKTLTGEPVPLPPDNYARHLAEQAEMAEEEQQRVLERAEQKAKAPRYAKFEEVPADLVPADVADHVKALDDDWNSHLAEVMRLGAERQRLVNPLLETLNAEVLAA